MNSKIYTLLLIFLISIVNWGCKEDWKDHYNLYPETVNENLWVQMQKDKEISGFVQLLEEYHYDTLFSGGISYTVFAPKNEAFNNYILNNNNIDPHVFLRYHISSHFIQSINIPGQRKVQTLSKKYALFERYGSTILIDGINITRESPLFQNGKYFTLSSVIEPKPNFYEYFKLANPVLSDYIDMQDSIAIDKEKSKPVGFDEDGNTIYDTVAIVYNKFEEKYFPVKQEFLSLTATMVFPNEEEYNEALNVMADAIGNNMNYKDIPIEWQHDILIPTLLNQGVFLNSLEPEEFENKTMTEELKLLNVLGDSVVIDYVPVEKTLLSNGYAYNYLDFTIPDSLYLGGVRLEAERLLKETGFSSYAWREEVIVESDMAIAPQREFISIASNDSILRVIFPYRYAGKYSVEFDSPDLFPRKYRMVISTHMDFGGVYEIYVNNELIRTFNYYDYVRFKGIIYSVDGSRFIPQARFNKFDMYVDNINEYGKTSIKLKYIEPGLVPNNGLVIDFIEFIPVEN